MPTEVEDLVGFVKPGSNAEVAREALQIVEGLSGSPDGIAPLRAVAPELVSNLLLCLPRPQLSRLAATALVNLSQDDRICMELVKAKACSRIITYVVEGKTSDHDVALMILSNLTRGPEGIAQALQEGQGAIEQTGMRSLLGLALNPGASEVMYEHIGGVLCNITQHELGRQLLVEGNLGGVRAAVAMLGARSTVLRTGAAAAVKNLVMSAKSDGWFEKLISSHDVLEKLLVPINGEPPKEVEDSVRENAAVSISLIAEDEEGRKALMEVGGDEKVKKGYEYEEHPATMEAMEAMWRSFLGVEAGDEDDDDVDGVVYIR
eukprot:jgi/Ulvmu1/10403/UM061_0087.1